MPAISTQYTDHKAKMDGAENSNPFSNELTTFPITTLQCLHKPFLADIEGHQHYSNKSKFTTATNNNQ